MKNLFLLPVFAILLLFSCKDELKEIEPEVVEDPKAYLMSLSDSCSFTIDGKVFNCNILIQSGKGTQSVNYDIGDGKGYPDSLLYVRNFGLSNYKHDAPDYGRLSITFMKKYGKNELQKQVISWFPSIKGPEDEFELFKLGQHPYAVDYDRLNTQNGVALTISYGKNNFFSTSLPGFRGIPTTIGYDCQEDSDFEIVSLQELHQGFYLLEAKFNANLFAYKAARNANNETINEVSLQKRVENGYIRLRVKM